MSDLCLDVCFFVSVPGWAIVPVSVLLYIILHLSVCECQYKCRYVTVSLYLSMSVGVCVIGIG